LGNQDAFTNPQLEADSEPFINAGFLISERLDPSTK